MSGHNKWSTIKHRKAAQDAKRGKVFTRIIKEITIAARLGGGDPDGNPRLRSALIAARSANMPKDNIERAVKKGTGELEGVSYEEVTYEGYGPAGVAILIDTVTDNTNRTVGEVRHVFTKRGQDLGKPGSVNWMFEEKGHIQIPKDQGDLDAIFEAGLEAGAEDVEDAGEHWLVSTAREELYEVVAALEAGGLHPTESNLAKVPKTTIEIGQVGDARKLLGLIDALEETDDVQTVWANFDLTDDVAAQLEA